MNWRAVMLLVFSFTASQVVLADHVDYGLEPVKVADSTYVFIGSTDHFTFKNGGNIVNTGFIVTSDGVVVIDTGSSKRYGEQMRAAIAKVTDKPIVRVYITHLHPDHFLGNQAFQDVPIAALPATRKALQEQGDDLAENMYGLVGDWMRGTEALAPTESVTVESQQVGDHRLRLLAYSGHTDGDLAILDETTGVLFAGDLVFYQRAPTTPHADLDIWLDSLRLIETKDFTVLVPGHGPVVNNRKPIAQTRDYLTWLGETLRTGAEGGLDRNEMMQKPIPPRFDSLNVLPEEFYRSIVHLYGGFEQSALGPVRSSD